VLYLSNAIFIVNYISIKLGNEEKKENRHGTFRKHTSDIRGGAPGSLNTLREGGMDFDCVVR
jgi:hypothetical protein